MKTLAIETLIYGTVLVVGIAVVNKLLYGTWTSSTDGALFIGAVAGWMTRATSHG